MKKNLLGFFIKCREERKFAKLLEYVVSTVVRYEYREWMPTEEVLDVVRAMEGTLGNVETMLEFILYVANAFQKVGKSEVYTEFCTKVLPPFEKYLVENSSTQIVRLLTKIFWASVNSYINSYFQEKSEAWLGFLRLVIASYEEEFHNNISTIEKHSNEFCYFSAKKWATRSVMKLIMNESGLKLTPEFKQRFAQTHQFFIE